MKNQCRLIFICFLISIFLVSGCADRKTYSDQQLTEMLYPVLQKEADGSDNLSVLLIKHYKDLNIVLFSCDYPDQHQVECRFFNICDNRIELLGGGGGMADCNHPMSFGIYTGIEEGPENSLSIIYGEIYDERIESVVINYTDGQTAAVKVQHKGYLAVRETTEGVSKINGLDQLLLTCRRRSE